VKHLRGGLPAQDKRVFPLSVTVESRRRDALATT